MKVIATYNIKGGVGKTATAVNLAYLAAKEGNRVLVWDLDPAGRGDLLLPGEAQGEGRGEGARPRQDASSTTW